MNIATILKKCPKGTKLYSPLFGEVILDCVKDGIEHSIYCLASDGETLFFMSDGRYFGDYTDAECMLFPSKDQRDWSKFVVPDKVPDKVHDKEPDQGHQFKPFERVLVRDDDFNKWEINFFSHIDEEGDYFCLRSYWKQCIPYEGNEHLVGTNNDPE